MRPDNLVEFQPCAAKLAGQAQGCRPGPVPRQSDDGELRTDRVRHLLQHPADSREDILDACGGRLPGCDKAHEVGRGLGAQPPADRVSEIAAAAAAYSPEQIW